MKLMDTTLFKALPRSSRPSLERVFKTVKLVPGQTLWTVDQPGDSLAVMLEGRCTLSRPSGDRHAVLGKLAPGALIGALTLLSPGPRAATLTADTDSTLAVLEGKAFRSIWRSGSPTAVQLQLVIARTLARELRNLDAQLSTLMDRPALELQDAEVRHMLPALYNLCEAALKR
jgi:CRP-like cAMP-binding protein